ncbi:MAG: Xaa-Pro peptidase family protein [Bacillota bacterium]
MENLFKKCDIAIITSPSNLFYFTGYNNADAIVLLSQKEKFYITDKRSTEEAKEVLVGWTIVDCGSNGYSYTAMAIINSKRCCGVGYEHGIILHSTYCELVEYGWSELNFVDISDEIIDLRAIKTQKELDNIKFAQAITDSAFSYIVKELKTGISEIEVSSKLNSYIYSKGATLAFDTIVAFGSNTSRPHSHPTDNKLQENDVVLIDFGAKLYGFCSDMTRSFAVGTPTQEYIEMYNHVLNAQLAALGGAKAGMTGIECDKLSRDYFKNHGLSEYFTHSLGHSLGIDIHESPNLNTRNDKQIPLNAVTSIEPGLYFEGKFGIRIEDIVIFKNNGVENLTNSKKTRIIEE